MRNITKSNIGSTIENTNARRNDALPSPGLNPLEGPTMLGYEKLGLEGRSRLPALKKGRGAC
jgi:hypothetical protein